VRVFDFGGAPSGPSPALHRVLPAVSRVAAGRHIETHAGEWGGAERSEVEGKHDVKSICSLGGSL